jgi:hypothetical protein
MAHSFVLFSFALLLAATQLQALPPDVEDLIQANKYAEALARVDALLKVKPADAELQQTRTDLQTELAKSGTVPMAPAKKTADTIPAPAPAPARPARPAANLPPLEARELELILSDLGRATGDARQKPLKELASRTAELTRTYPDSINLWAMRGLAVLELEQATAAKEAGANLLRLGADQTGNEQVINLLAMLKRKGWLKTPQEIEEERRLAAEQGAEAQRHRAEAERQAAANRAETERKAAAYRASPAGIAERLRRQLGGK